MANKIPSTPKLSRPPGRQTLASLVAFDQDLTRSLHLILQEIAQRLNIAVTTDGGETMQNPLLLATYTVATLPTASDWTQGLIYVSDESGGATPAFSDGTNWRRVHDRAIVS